MLEEDRQTLNKLIIKTRIKDVKAKEELFKQILELSKTHPGIIPALDNGDIAMFQLMI